VNTVMNSRVPQNVGKILTFVHTAMNSRVLQNVGYSGFSHHFVEPESSLPCSQNVRIFPTFCEHGNELSSFSRKRRSHEANECVINVKEMENV
jgi:hypothetical protein